MPDAWKYFHANVRYYFLSLGQTWYSFLCRGRNGKGRGADEGKEKGKGMVCDRQQLWQDADGGLSPCDYHNYKYRLLLLAGECLKLPSQTAPTAPHPHARARHTSHAFAYTRVHTHRYTHAHVHTSMGSNLRLSLFSPATKLSFRICNAFMLQLLP